MERVLIVGCPGSGKSTAARRLAALTGLPIIHLDRHYWQPGWQPPAADVWAETVRELASRPCWIMDGNYAGTFDIRLAAADTLIHLDFSTAVCAWRAARRTIRSFGRARGEDVPDDCPERFDWAFLHFVLSYRRQFRTRDMERLAGFRGTTHRFASPGKLDLFLKGFSQRATVES